MEGRDVGQGIQGRQGEIITDFGDGKSFIAWSN
jgi:hypothetical protein